MTKRNATVVAFCSAKGGCSKTTTCLNFGAGYLPRKNKKVLFIDTDYQSNLTSSLMESFGKKLTSTKKKEFKYSSIYRAFVHQATNSQGTFPSNFKPVHITNDVDLMASSPKLDQISNLMRNKSAIAPYVLLTVFAKLKLPMKYDYILIDCHNSFTITVQNALACADYCISPIMPSEYSLDSIATMIRKINEIKSNLIDPINQKSLVTAKLYFIGSMIKYNTKNSHQFKRAIKGNRYFIASIPFRELFNRATSTNIYELSNREATEKHRYNDKNVVKNAINPQFENIYKAIGGK